MDVVVPGPGLPHTPLLPAGAQRTRAHSVAGMVRTSGARATGAKVVASLERVSAKAEGAVTQGGGAASGPNSADGFRPYKRWPSAWAWRRA